MELLDFEAWYNEEDLYCAYMESGAYYEMEQEDFDENEYEVYVKTWEREEERKQATKA